MLIIIIIDIENKMVSKNYEKIKTGNVAAFPGKIVSNKSCH